MTMTQPVQMYTTAVCPFCIRAKQLLHARGVTHIEEMRIDLDDAKRQAMMTRTQRRTVPQIYIGDTHVGGYDDLMALDAKGGLLPLLSAVG
jgi:glutaredoxin 3